MEFSVAVAPVDSPAALSLINAAQDELNRRYGEGADDEHLQLENMVPPRGAFLVARLGEDLAAGVGLRTIGDPEDHLGEIKRLWVRPDLRGSGVAVLIMDRALEVARELFMVQIYLETGWAQPEAQRFYQKTGWISVDSFPEGTFSYPLGTKFTKFL